VPSVELKEQFIEMIVEYASHSSTQDARPLATLRDDFNAYIEQLQRQAKGRSFLLDEWVSRSAG
jgi:hypothetical protein